MLSVPHCGHSNGMCVLPCLITLVLLYFYRHLTAADAPLGKQGMSTPFIAVCFLQGVVFSNESCNCSACNLGFHVYDFEL